MTAAAQSGRRAAQVMSGVVFMLILAAVLEAFPRQLLGTTERFVIGMTMLALWLGYFFAFRRQPISGDPA